LLPSCCCCCRCCSCHALPLPWLATAWQHPGVAFGASDGEVKYEPAAFGGATTAVLHQQCGSKHMTCSGAEGPDGKMQPRESAYSTWQPPLRAKHVLSASFQGLQVDTPHEPTKSTHKAGKPMGCAKRWAHTCMRTHIHKVRDILQLMIQP
jgi:hypothetical protein